MRLQNIAESVELHANYLNLFGKMRSSNKVFSQIWKFSVPFLPSALYLRGNGLIHSKLFSHNCCNKIFIKIIAGEHQPKTSKRRAIEPGIPVSFLQVLHDEQ